MIDLRGITWDHTRGYLPMVATAQRFSELHPDVSVRWDKRSLQHFADFPLERLVEHYDLLVIDHPFVGYAATHKVLKALDSVLPPEFLENQAGNSVGQSHESYRFDGHQWALAVDAATPICGYRSDLMAKHGADIPRNWSELLDLASRGLVAVSGIGIDSLCHFYMLCGVLGEDPFATGDHVVSRSIGIEALQMLGDLLHLAVPGCLERNPIAIWELLTRDNTAALCPFAYGYSNYGRATYCEHPLQFTGLVAIDGRRCRSTLGGAGLAVSAYCKQVEAAAEYCLFVAGAETQRGLYFTSGGQPGHREGWLDAKTNADSNNFFQETLSTLDEAWLRPRWHGYLTFQDQASQIVSDYLHDRNTAEQALDNMDALLSRAKRGDAE
jgi:multiple sugar transport system substrate-binding protein